MCIRITERFAVCGCIYYVHGVDQCGAAGRHPVQERTVLVGHTCAAHAGAYAASSSTSSPYPTPAYAGSPSSSSYRSASPQEYTGGSCPRRNVRGEFAGYELYY